MSRAARVLALCLGLFSTALAAQEDAADGQPSAASEPEAVLPAHPSGNLIEFDSGINSANRYFLDRDSLSVLEGDEVRFTLVIDARGGARNVSYEGIRCSSFERRTYAVGRADGSWVRSRRHDWLRITGNRVNRHHSALATSYLCNNGIAVRSAAEAFEAIRRGGVLSTTN